MTTSFSTFHEVILKCKILYLSGETSSWFSDSERNREQRRPSNLGLYVYIWTIDFFVYNLQNKKQDNDDSCCNLHE